MIYYVALRKEAVHTVTVRVEADTDTLAVADAEGIARRNPRDWDSIVESEPVVVDVKEGD
jgi:hypothetical protein